MGRNNKGQKGLRIENIEIYNHYLARLISAAMAEFVWKGLPETCDPIYFERTLVFRNTASIYNLPESPDTWLSTGYVMNSQFNVYGYPVDISGVGYNTANIPVDKFQVCYDTNLKEPMMPKIELYARLLYEVHNTFRSNLRQQNTPYIVKSDRNTLLTIRNFFNNLFGYDPVIEVRPSLDTSKIIETLDLRVDFKGKEMLECLQMVWRDALSMLGITEGSDKKERMLEDEVALNRMSDVIALNTRLSPRVDFCRRFNEMTGMNISVHLSTEQFELEPYEEKEVVADENSSTNNSSADNSGADNSAS